MANKPPSWPPNWNLGDLLKHVGRIPPRRIRLHPSPGTATEQDVIDIQAREGRLYELVDGVLVEKPMGYFESCVAAVLIQMLRNFLDQADLGLVAGADGAVRLMPGLVRIPDVSFISWDRLPGRAIPARPIPNLVPDLAAEVLSAGNTKAEMERKLKEYFLAGVSQVWLIDPERRRVTVYTAPDAWTRFEEADTLDGGAVLPGFSLPVGRLFAPVGGRRPAPPKGQRAKRKDQG